MKRILAGVMMFLGIFYAFTIEIEAKTNSKSSIVTSDEIPKFTPGEGGRYIMNNGQDKNEMKVFFLESSKDKIVIEVHMKSMTDSDALNIDMSQQFHLKMLGGTFQLVKGILKIPHIEKPQILPTSALSGLGSMQMKGFLIGSSKDIDGEKVGTETITENGKSYSTTHYKNSEGGQTLHFWVSDEAKPIGLVRLKSEGGKSGETYSLSYQGKETNLKSRINAAQAEPLSPAAQMFLPLMGAGFSSK